MTAAKNTITIIKVINSMENGMVAPVLLGEFVLESTRVIVGTIGVIIGMAGVMVGVVSVCEMALTIPVE